MSRPLPRATVQPIRLEPGRRALVISDIHAVRPLFEGVLRRAHYRPEEDTLILLGDMVEKGPDSLSFLRWLMEFVRDKDVRFVRGNCDHLIPEQAHGWASPTRWRYMQAQPMSLLWQLGREGGFVPQGPDDLPRLGEVIARQCAPELAFIESWPTILEGDQVIFVHGGVPTDENLTEYDAFSCMKNDRFLEQETHLRRWCVVGHTPVTLYHSRIPSSQPIVDREKKIIAIDGGCALKPDGQLNCLILPSLELERIVPQGLEWVSFDGLPTVTALEGQEPSRQSQNICWGNHQVEVLEAGEEFSRCRQVSTGYEMDILTEFLWRREDATFTQDATDYRLPVSPGDVLSVVRLTRRGILAKKDGVTGWYFGKSRPLDPGIAPPGKTGQLY